jgi:hypothetical protein
MVLNFSFVIFSCFVFVLHTLPSMSEYNSTCEMCKPVTGDFISDDAIAARAALKDQCNGCEPLPDRAFFYLEFVCATFFNLWFLIQLITAFAAHSEPEQRVSQMYEFPRFRAFKRTFLFLRNPFNLISLAANISDIYSVYIAGAWLGRQQQAHLSIVRIIKMVRLVRLFHPYKWFEPSHLLMRVMMSSVHALITQLFLIMLGTLLLGTLIYYAEQGSWNAETGWFMRKRPIDEVLEISPFASIPHSFWW